MNETITARHDGIRNLGFNIQGCITGRTPGKGRGNIQEVARSNIPKHETDGEDLQLHGDIRRK